MAPQDAAPRDDAPIETNTTNRATEPVRRSIGLRRTRVDAYRVYAMLLIIWAHSEAALGVLARGVLGLVPYGLNIVGHVAIPLFLVLAGNHLGPRLLGGGGILTAWNYLRRLAGLFVVSSLVYFTFGSMARGHLADGPVIFVQHAQRLLRDPVALLLYGTSRHLWFLVALMFTTLLAAVVLRGWRLRTLGIIAGCLYLAAVLTGPYAIVLGRESGRAAAVGILQAPLFFVIGIVLADPRKLTRSLVAWGLVAVGSLLHAAEVYWLSALYGQSAFGRGMLMGTLVMGLGIGLVALQPRPSALDRIVAAAGALVPMVYLGHVLFLDLLVARRRAFDPAVFHVLLPAAVALCAFASAWLLRRAGAWRRAAMRHRQYENAGPSRP